MTFPRSTTPRTLAAIGCCVLALVFFQQLPQFLRWPSRLALIVSVLWLVVTIVRGLWSMRHEKKNIIFSLVIAALLYGALHVMCVVFLQFMARRDDRATVHEFKTIPAEGKRVIELMLNGGSYTMFDRELGWAPRPGFRSELYNISSQGLRGLREYPETSPHPEKRVLCLGDSFTFGYSVHDNETYPYYAEQLRPDTEWLNLGISGASVTQSLLQYRKNGRRFGGKYVVIGFMIKDAQRTVNCFHPFIAPVPGGPWPLTRPFVKFSKGRFTFEPNPFQSEDDYRRLLANESAEIERLKRIDYLTWSNQTATSNPILRTADYASELLQIDQNVDQILSRPPSKNKSASKSKSADPYGGRKGVWDPASLGFQAITRLVDLYYKEVIADGREPLIVIIPGPLDVEDFSRKLTPQYASLVEHLKAKHMRYFDFLKPLTEKHKQDLSMDALFIDYHFNATVNKELAEEVVKAVAIP